MLYSPVVLGGCLLLVGSYAGIAAAAGLVRLMYCDAGKPS